MRRAKIVGRLLEARRVEREESSTPQSPPHRQIRDMYLVLWPLIGFSRAPRARDDPCHTNHSVFKHKSSIKILYNSPRGCPPLSNSLFKMPAEDKNDGSALEKAAAQLVIAAQEQTKVNSVAVVESSLAELKHIHSHAAKLGDAIAKHSSDSTTSIVKELRAVGGEISKMNVMISLKLEKANSLARAQLIRDALVTNHKEHGMLEQDIDKALLSFAKNAGMYVNPPDEYGRNAESRKMDYIKKVAAGLTRVLGKHIEARKQEDGRFAVFFD